jgi:nicotinate-nucleotide adenylyltransferase
MNLGIYGGSFDPPHIGHLALADSAMEAFALDTVLLVPAWRSPFKQHDVPAPPELRAEMVELAISDNRTLKGEYSEILRAGLSWTVDTLRDLRVRHPEARLHLLMGADTFAEFHLWREPEEIASMAALCVAQRPGAPDDPAAHPFGDRVRTFSMPQLGISSSDIRRRVREGRSIRYLVPWTVRTFIEARGLYR